MALTDEESRMVARLETEAQQTPARFRRQAVIILAGALVVAAIASVRGLWPLAGLCVVGGAGLYWLGQVAARKNSNDRSAPVLRALREAPERVKTIAHAETSDSLRLFVSHWIVVTTDDGHLRVRADDWKSLMAALERRCPGARVGP